MARKKADTSTLSAKEVKDLRRKTLLIGLNVGKKEKETLYRRAVDPEKDFFADIYGPYKLRIPPYPFENLYTIYEESDVLQSCIDVMRKNVDGFGHQLIFLGNDASEKEKQSAMGDWQTAEDFFYRVNEDQSFSTIRQMMRMDLEVLGNGAFEVVRSLDNSIAVMYYMPFKYVRMSLEQEEAVEIEVDLPRNGKVIPVKFKKYFRKYAQVRADGKTLRWFKEYGDPRPMDADTGSYTAIKTPASELKHFKLAFGGLAYGLPRWIGASLSVLGRRQADFINYDLFENQGIPPMVVMVSGGTLTEESLESLQALVRGMRGVKNWSRVAVLESVVESVGLEERGTARVELKNLSEYRKEDLMFKEYLESTERVVRHSFRLHPLLTGSSETFTYATAKAAQTVAEEQVFVPERLLFDEWVNNQLMVEIGVKRWKFKSKGPRIVGAPEISQAMNAFTQSGALSVNHAIDRANEAFGLEMSKFDAPWANYPVIYVMEMIRQGQIQASDVVEGIKPLPVPVVQPQQGKLPPPQKKLPSPAAVKKMIKSDILTDEEKELLLMVIDKLKEGGY